jgi:hypothetical protein
MEIKLGLSLECSDDKIVVPSRSVLPSADNSAIRYGNIFNTRNKYLFSTEVELLSRSFVDSNVSNRVSERIKDIILIQDNLFDASKNPSI